MTNVLEHNDDLKFFLCGERVISALNIFSYTGKITLHDLKRCKMTNVFFDTFFNIEKYLDREQKDQFSMLRVSMKL